MEKTLKFLKKIGFESRGPLFDDSAVQYCKCCNRGAWLIDDIKHTKDCELGQVLKEVKNVKEKKNNVRI